MELISAGQNAPIGREVCSLRSRQAGRASVHQACIVALRPMCGAQSLRPAVVIAGPLCARIDRGALRCMPGRWFGASVLLYCNHSVPSVVRCLLHGCMIFVAITGLPLLASCTGTFVLLCWMFD
jgi:hypothetical protein